MAARWCEGPADAEDAAQEVLLRLIRQKVRPENDLAWLAVVTRRVCHRMRLSDAQRTRVEESFLSDRVDVSPSEELAMEVRDVLAALPDRDRRVLELVICGVTAHEMALLMGCKTRDVGQLVTRARRKARRIRDRS